MSVPCPCDPLWLGEWGIGMGWGENSYGHGEENDEPSFFFGRRRNWSHFGICVFFALCAKNHQKHTKKHKYKFFLTIFKEIVAIDGCAQQMHQVGGALDKQSQKCFLFFSWRHWGHTLTFAIPISISKASRSNRGKENVILVAPIHTWIGISPIAQFRRDRLWKKEKNIEKKKKSPFSFYVGSRVCYVPHLGMCNELQSVRGWGHARNTDKAS